MSRHINVRLKSRSPLDAIADGSQARAFGLTRRLHDVAARYEFMIRSYHPSLRDGEIAGIAAGLRTLGILPTSLATPALIQSLKDQLCTAARTHYENPLLANRVAMKVRQLSAIGLVVVLELVEEAALADRS